MCDVLMAVAQDRCPVSPCPRKTGVSPSAPFSLFPLLLAVQPQWFLLLRPISFLLNTLLLPPMPIRLLLFHPDSLAKSPLSPSNVCHNSPSALIFHSITFSSSSHHLLRQLSTPWPPPGRFSPLPVQTSACLVAPSPNTTAILAP